MRSSLFRPLRALAAMALGLPVALAGQARNVTARPSTLSGPAIADTTWLAGLRWREVGPARGGRTVAVGGSVQRPNEYWMGTTGGGVFKSTDGGVNWAAAT